MRVAEAEAAEAKAEAKADGSRSAELEVGLRNPSRPSDSSTRFNHTNIVYQYRSCYTMPLYCATSTLQYTFSRTVSTNQSPNLGAEGVLAGGAGCGAERVALQARGKAVTSG